MRFAGNIAQRRIEQEFTKADRPQLNGVAERGLTLIDKLALGLRFPGEGMLRRRTVTGYRSSVARSTQYFPCVSA